MWRSGRQLEIPAADLVAGDVVALEAGNVVPADLRLFEAANLRIQEAALTGESEGVDKTTDPIPDPGAPLGDRTNLAFSGTQVSNGRGLGIVVATGMRTELGRIAALLQDVKSGQTPLQERLDKVGKQLAVCGVFVAFVVMGLGALAGDSFGDLVLTAISVAVAVIPEGLPAVVTFTLAIGAQRMLKRNALIRKLPAVETLGSVTVICSDKTGTLTQNRMTVTLVEVAGDRIELGDGAAPDLSGMAPALRYTVAGGALCNDGVIDISSGDGFTTIGDPTETALLVAAHDLGFDVEALRDEHPRIGERPFDSDRKRMSTVHAPLSEGGDGVLSGLPTDGTLVFVKGAIDGLLAHATHVWDIDGPVAIDDEWRQRVTNANDALAASGRRVLGVAFRTLDDSTDLTAAEDDLVLLGIVGIIDPPRAEVRDAVGVCTTAGIRTVMITGDHPLTAQAIAADLGIGREGGALTGRDLDQLDDAGLDEAVATVSVYARVSPEHKLRIVKALQHRGEIVAMTGDGVNDAPALKTSDIGVAMGITGTDVSKEASDMVLRDDNFATIVASVEEGRVIYDNLRRFVKFAVAGNIGKILVMVGWPIPFLITGHDLTAASALLPLQLLWLNLMTDGLLGLSMGVEPAERGVMRRPPHAPDTSLWAGGLGRQAAWLGLAIGSMSLAVGYIYYEADRPEFQTMMFTSLAFLQIFQALGSRSTEESLKSLGLRTNKVMLGIVGAVVALQLLAIYTPLREFLDVEPLPFVDLMLCIAIGVVLLIGIETTKLIRRRRNGAPAAPQSVAAAGSVTT